MSDPAGIRELQPKRSHAFSNPAAVAVVSLYDAADTTWTPVPGAVHTMVPTAGRSLTITAADMLAYNLSDGEGFVFWVQNNSGGANTITVVAGGGANVSTGTGTTLTIAQAYTRQFVIARSGTTYTIYSLSYSQQ